MDPVLFGAKRAYYATLEYGRKVLAEFGLTPARFEVLHLLLDKCESQRHLRGRLGLARSTLSRMLSVLEALGWVRRQDDIFDRRTRGCLLTEAGTAKVREVMYSVMRRGVVRGAVNRTLRRLPGTKKLSRRRLTMAVFHELREGFVCDLYPSKYWRDTVFTLDSARLARWYKPRR